VEVGQKYVSMNEIASDAVIVAYRFNPE
jgi:hypothetical protein